MLGGPEMHIMAQCLDAPSITAVHMSMRAPNPITLAFLAETPLALAKAAKELLALEMASAAKEALSYPNLKRHPLDQSILPLLCIFGMRTDG
jgi:hypothetical protein